MHSRGQLHKLNRVGVGESKLYPKMRGFPFPEIQSILKYDYLQNKISWSHYMLPAVEI